MHKFYFQGSLTYFILNVYSYTWKYYGHIIMTVHPCAAQDCLKMNIYGLFYGFKLFYLPKTASIKFQTQKT